MTSRCSVPTPGKGWRNAAACVLAVAAFGGRAQADTTARLEAPEPSTFPRPIVRENGPSPRFYTLRPPAGWFVARLSLGGGVRVYGPSANTAAFAFDALVGARLALHRADGPAWALLPDLGYGNLALGAESNSHLFMAGLGLGQIRRGSAVGIVPRFVVGEEHGRAARGVRTAVIAEGFMGVTGLVVELSHTFLALDRGASHDVRLSVGIDPTMLFTRQDCHVRLYGDASESCGR